MDWSPYIKAGWQLVMDSEGRTQIHLRQELESYLVHMMARTMVDPGIPPDIICLEFVKAKTRDDFRRIGDSCLLVDAWGISKSKAVSDNYYEDMGRVAYSYASIRSHPVDELFEEVSKNFKFLSKVLKHTKS
jgi:hypothetical protein